MKNFIEPGDTITAPAPIGGILSGGLFISGSMIGVAMATASVGIPVAVKTSGIFEFAKVSAQAWTIGASIYWDSAAGNATTTSAGNTLIGYASEPAANPSSVGRVRLTPRGA